MIIEQSPQTKVDPDVQLGLDQLRTIEEQKGKVAQALKGLTASLIEPVKEKLPPLLYITCKNLSNDHVWTSSNEDPGYHGNIMEVVVYETLTGRLYKLSVRFVSERRYGGEHTFGKGWANRSVKETYLKKPDYHYLDLHHPDETEMWLDFGIKAIMAAKQVLIKCEKGEPITPPTHKRTYKSLVPDHLPQPYSKIQ